MEQEKAIFALQRTYTFSDCCKVLHVDFKTFKKWLVSDNINEHESTYDARVKYLTADQVETLALRHGRPWPPSGQQQEETITPSAYKQLMEQLAITAQQAAQVRADQAMLRTALETQEALQSAIATQQGQIETLQQDHQQDAQRTIDTLRDHGDKIGSFNSTLTELRGRYQHAATEREKLAQEQQATAAKLETLTAASKEHQQQLRRELDTLSASQKTAVTQLDQAQSAKLDRISAAFEEKQQQLRLQLDTVTTQQQQTAAKLDTLAATSVSQGRQLQVTQSTLTAIQTMQTALTTASAAQDKRLENITSSIDALKKQSQQDIERMQKSIQEEFQGGLRALRQATEKQTRDIYAAIQSAAQDEAQDVQLLTQQIEESSTKAEAAITIAQGAAQQLATLDQRIQAEQAERERLTLRLAENRPVQPPTEPKKRAPKQP